MSGRPPVNVIYTGGTVARLAPFLDTLLERTPWDFRLVANGCRADETAHLARRGDRYPGRVELRTVSGGAAIPHGDALDRLVERETAPYFAVMDSDIFATGAPSADLVPPDGVGGVCSCLPMWHRPSDAVMPSGYRIMGGRYLRTEHGIPLGCTYAMTYDAAVLRATLDRWDVTLRAYDWRELPKPVRVELSERNVRCDRYDTAKIANLMLHVDGRPVEYVEMPELVHVGAQSGPSAPRRPGRSLVRRGRSAVRTSIAFTNRSRARRLMAEARSTADLRTRRRSAVALVEAIAAGDSSAAEQVERAGWLDPRARDELAAVIAPRAASDS